ncbi:MAG: hypothetical protein IKE30_03410, partial [Clostridia bacterium]|nr:hypothetical protein [Clostridia bacterium]
MKRKMHRIILSLVVVLSLLAAFAAFAEEDRINYENWELVDGEWIYIGDDPDGEGMNPPPLPFGEEDEEFADEDYADEDSDFDEEYTDDEDFEEEEPKQKKSEKKDKKREE